MSDKRGQSNVVDDEIDFCWGKKRGRSKDKEYQFYESFKFDGVEYSLYDSIYLFKVGENEPYVGKIIKIWEHSSKTRKVKVLWFFRPSEISSYLQGVDVLENELFLATGRGTGLVNVNPLEAIAGKCNVVCISKDEKNQQPSIEELKLADYVFYRTFDVEKLTISEKLDKEIATVDVKSLLNKNDPEPGNIAMLDGVNVAVDTTNPLISAKDNLVVDRFIDHDTTIASSVMKADKLTRDFTALPISRPEKLGAGVSDTVTVVGVDEKTNSKKDTRHIDGDVKCSTVLGSSLVKKEKHSIEKGKDSRPDNSDVVPSTSKRVLKSDKKTTLKSPDLIQTKLNKVGEGGYAATSPEKEKSEPVNDVKKRIATAGNFKSEDRLSKKLKMDGSAQKTIGDSGTVTQTADNVSPASNKVSEPGSAVETNVSGKLKKVSVGLSDNPLTKQKYNGATLATGGKTSDKSNKALGKQSKELENFLGKVSMERDGTSEGVSKRRTNSLIEQKPNGKLRKLSNKQSNDDDENGASNQVKEVTQRPLDRSKWFTDGSVEDRMKDAYDEERLVLLLNLDPTSTASEVKNFVSCAFQESCSVQMVQPTATSSPHSGQAFAIFNTREVALKIIQKLERGCLMLPNGRPLVGFINEMSFHGKQSHFFGHLAIDKHKHQMQKDMRGAVSTSHSAQPNTIEYEMALEWRLLQDRSDLWWKLLHQNQGEEIRKVKASKPEV